MASGYNDQGQLGLLHEHDVAVFKPCSLAHVLHAEDIKSMAAGFYHSILLTTSNRMLVSGGNDCGQLGLGLSEGVTSFTECNTIELKPEESIERVAASNSHTIVLTNYHRLFVCGNNGSGRPGFQSGGNHNKFTQYPIVLQENEVIIDVAAASGHTLLTTNQKRILVSGHNSFGQLGLDHCNNVSTFQESPAAAQYKLNKPSKSESKAEEPEEKSEIGPGLRG